MAMAKAYLNETSGDEEDMRRTIRRLIQENSSLIGENAELSSQVNVSQDWIMRQSSFLDLPLNLRRVALKQPDIGWQMLNRLSLRIRRLATTHNQTEWDDTFKAINDVRRLIQEIMLLFAEIPGWTKAALCLLLQIGNSLHWWNGVDDDDLDAHILVEEAERELDLKIFKIAVQRWEETKGQWNIERDVVPFLHGKYGMPHDGDGRLRVLESAGWLAKSYDFMVAAKCFTRAHHQAQLVADVACSRLSPELVKMIANELVQRPSHRDIRYDRLPAQFGPDPPSTYGVGQICLSDEEDCPLTARLQWSHVRAQFVSLHGGMGVCKTMFCKGHCEGQGDEHIDVVITQDDGEYYEAEGEYDLKSWSDW